MTERKVRCQTCDDPLRSDVGPTVATIADADEGEQRQAAEVFMDEHRHHHVDGHKVSFTVDPPFEESGG